MADKSNAIAVGLTGQFGAGCTTVGEYLEETGFHYYSLSRIIKTSLQKRLGPIEYEKLSKKKGFRRELQNEGNRLREPDTQAIAKQVFDEIKSAHHESEDIVIDSIRNPMEVEFFNATFPRFFLLALDASSDVRLLRTKSSYEDDEEQFKQDDMRDKGDEEPVYGQHAETCVYQSDVVIDNEEAIGYRQDWDLFFYKIKEYVDLMREPGFRGPTYKELYMHIAYAISLKSSCNKRRVGAVIVSSGVSETGAMPGPRDEAGKVIS